MAKQSAPKPFPVGSTTGREAAIARMASMAFPPFKSVCNPAELVEGLPEQHIPFLA